MMGDGEEEVIREYSRQAGVDALLIKPIKCSQLFDTIMEVFGQQVPKLYRDRRKQADYSDVIDRIGGTRL
ncbi:MAG: hypothetical protein WCG26_16005, partial [Chloroflexales bacterium]